MEASNCHMHCFLCCQVCEGLDVFMVFLVPLLGPVSFLFLSFSSFLLLLWPSFVLLCFLFPFLSFPLLFFSSLSIVGFLCTFMKISRSDNLKRVLALHEPLISMERSRSPRRPSSSGSYQDPRVILPVQHCSVALSTCPSWYSAEGVGLAGVIPPPPLPTPTWAKPGSHNFVWTTLEAQLGIL